MIVKLKEYKKQPTDTRLGILKFLKALPDQTARHEDILSHFIKQDVFILELRTQLVALVEDKSVIKHTKERIRRNSETHEEIKTNIIEYRIASEGLKEISDKTRWQVQTSVAIAAALITFAFGIIRIMG